MARKITIIGAGSVGSTIAYALSFTDIASEIVLIDVNKEKVEGEVMDINQGTSFRAPISFIAGEYEDAMVYFEACCDRESYSSAYERVREAWLNDNLMTVVVIAVIALIVLNVMIVPNVLVAVNV